MSRPTVCAVMLTRDRPELAKRAVECFRAQTYPAKALLIYNTGEDDAIECGCSPECFHVQHTEVKGESIGALRNRANGFRMSHPAQHSSEIIIHWDDDDWSHPNRIAEQVAFLESSGADVVGYNEMLFWRQGWCDRKAESEAKRIGDVGRYFGEAWLYSYGPPKPTLGTSLCYWRETWEARPFRNDLPNNRESTGEDTDFIRERKVAACSSLHSVDPRMIARIHGANFTKYNIEESNGSWKLVPEWDNRIKEILNANGTCWSEQ